MHKTISEEKLIQGCVEGSRYAQKVLYEKYQSLMFAICMRYAKNRDEAEDVMIDGFMKIFSKISEFRKQGSFEGWLKRIMINTAINNYRLNIWNTYYDGFGELEKSGKIELPYIPEGCTHNAHMFYIKAKDLQERTALISFLKENGIQAVFHYIPLHSAPAGKKFGRFHGEDKYTTRESERLMRLPMYYGLKDEEVQYIISKVKEFYK